PERRLDACELGLGLRDARLRHGQAGVRLPQTLGKLRVAQTDERPALLDGIAVRREHLDDACADLGEDFGLIARDDGAREALFERQRAVTNLDGFDDRNAVAVVAPVPPVLLLRAASGHACDDDDEPRQYRTLLKLRHYAATASVLTAGPCQRPTFRPGHSTSGHAANDNRMRSIVIAFAKTYCAIARVFAPSRDRRGCRCV